MSERSQQHEWDNKIRSHIQNGQDLHAQGNSSAAETCFRTALEQLVTAYQNGIVGFCRNMLRNYAQQADDVAQEVFLAAWRTMPGFRHQASIRTWIFAIARNQCWDELKQLTRHTRTLSFEANEQQDIPAVELSPEDQYAQQNFLSYVTDGLAQLDSRDREVLVFTYISEMSRVDIARLLGIAVTSVGTRRKRALDRLREVIGHEKR